jgi:hypothetical protein
VFTPYKIHAHSLCVLCVYCGHSISEFGLNPSFGKGRAAGCSAGWPPSKFHRNFIQAAAECADDMIVE